MTEKKDSTEMAEDIVDAIDDEAGPDDVEDGLTKRERNIEVSRVAERERKAEELRKQLRKRSLGMLNYRWAAYLLFIGGIIAIITNFMQAMTRTAIVPADVGFNTFLDAFLMTGGVLYLFPVIAGAFMIVLSYFAYSNPKRTWLALIPGMMLAMAGFMVYFLVTFAVNVPGQEYLAGEIYSTFTPILMISVAAINLIAVFVREKE